MAEQYTRDEKFALSTLAEATYNTALTTAGDYTALVLDPVPSPIPQPEQTPIAGNTEQPTGFCNDYWTPQAVQFNPLFLFSGFPGRLALQAMGSSVTTAQQGGTAAYKHSATLQTGASLKGRSMAVSNGNYSFLFHGNAVSKYAISQVGGALPVVEVGMIGSGKYTTPVPFTVPSPSNACSPIVTTAILITDGYGTRDLYVSATSRPYSWRFEFDNAPDATSELVRSGADSTQGPSGGLARYIARIQKGFPRPFALTVTVPFEDLSGTTYGYWEEMVKSSGITTVTLRLRGDQISGSYYYEHAWTIADARITATPIVDSNTIQAYNLTITPVYNATPLMFHEINITTSDFN